VLLALQQQRPPGNCTQQGKALQHSTWDGTSQCMNSEQQTADGEKGMHTKRSAAIAQMPARMAGRWTGGVTLLHFSLIQYSTVSHVQSVV
jgi:hypothetical protein